MWAILLKNLAVRLSLPFPRPSSEAVSVPRGEASPASAQPWSRGCCSHTTAELEGTLPAPSRQVSPIHSSAGTSHRVRKHKQKGAECLSDPSSHRGERMFSTSLSKSHGQVQDSNPVFSNFSLQEKWFKSYWQTPGRTTSRRLLCIFVSSPSPQKSHLVSKQTTLSQHPCASRRDQNSPGLFLMKWQNFWCKHSEIRLP